MANIVESFDGDNGSAPSGTVNPGAGGIVDIQGNKLRTQTGPAGDATALWGRSGLANGDLTVEVTPSSTDGQRLDVLARASSLTGSGGGGSGPVPDTIPFTITNKSGIDECYIYVLGTQLTTGYQGWCDEDGVFTRWTTGIGPTPIDAPDVAITGPTDGNSITIDLPKLSGRVWFSYNDKMAFKIVEDGLLVQPAVQNPSDPNIDILFNWSEFTLDPGGLWINSTQVDIFASPYQVGLERPDGAVISTGRLKEDGFQNVVDALEATSGWEGLVKYSGSDVIRILSPTLAIETDDLDENVYQSYINQAWDRYKTDTLVIRPYAEDPAQVFYGTVDGSNVMTVKDSSNVTVATFNRPDSDSVFGCHNDLEAPNNIIGAIARTIASALNRSTMHVNPNQPDATGAAFYQNVPTNYYAKFIHQQMVNGRAYAYAFDDVGQHESLVHDAHPQAAFLQLDPFTGAAEELGDDSSVIGYGDGYTLRASVSSGGLSINKYTAGVLTELATATFSWVAGITHKIRFQFSGSNLRAKVWKSTDSQPSAWTIDTTDSTHTAAANIGLAVTTQVGTRLATWDNLQVVDLDSSSGGGGSTGVVKWESKGDTLGGAESGTWNIPVPPGVGPGDIVIVDLYKENDRDVTNSSGFQEIGTPTATGGPGDEHHHQFWKRSTGVEPATYSFQYNTDGLTGPQTWRTGVANRYSGADPTGNPVEAFSSNADAGPDTLSPSVSLTTSGPNRLLVWSATVSDYANLDTAPTGFTERVDDGYHIAVATKLQEGAGLSGSVVGEFSISSPRTARLLALKPGSSGPAASVPTVSAGADVALDLGSTLSRTATEDDGGASISARSWKIQSGPVMSGTTLSTTSVLNWTPTVTGIYTLRFTATNSAGTSYDEVTVTVSIPPPAPALEEPAETVHLDPKSWYAGPLGNLRELDTPETVSCTQVQYAGIHRGLSGAYVQDFTGVRSKYDLDFEWLEFPDYQWLNAMNTHHLPAPFYIRDPLLKNRLTASASRLTAGPLVDPGIQSYGVITRSRDLPDGLEMAGQSVVIDEWPGHPLSVRFDGARPVPAFPGEAVTGSVYLKSGPGESQEGMLWFEYYDRDGLYLGRSEATEFAVPDDDWERFSVSYVTPLGVAAMRMRLDVGAIESDETPSDGPLYVAAPQIEAGLTATEWQIGGAMTQVLIHEFNAESPRYPYWNVEVTFMEA